MNWSVRDVAEMLASVLIGTGMALLGSLVGAVGGPLWLFYVIPAGLIAGLTIVLISKAMDV